MASTELKPLVELIDLPGNRGRIHTATLSRWITRGFPTRDGKRVHLRAERVGGKWKTCEQWILEFIEAMTRGSLADMPKKPHIPDGVP